MNDRDLDDEGGYHGRRRAAYRSARSALRLLNRSAELYRETGGMPSRLPGISSYVAVMDAWKALAVDASSWKDGGKGKRKRDEAMEVIRNIRLRRLRVYDPRSGNDDDDGDDGDAGGCRRPTNRCSCYIPFSRKPSSMPYEKIAKEVLLSSDERRIDLSRSTFPLG